MNNIGIGKSRRPGMMRHVIDGHNSTLFLGSFDGTNQMFDGKLDDIKIFNCALTEWEIQELFNE